MQFGVFDHIDRSAVPLDRFYTDRLRLMRRVRSLRLLRLPRRRAPRDAAGRSAVARRMARRRGGTHKAIAVRPTGLPPPVISPLKLLEEICMLDQISGGRMMLGVGRGISPIELRYYGIDPDTAPSMYAEALK